MGVYFGVIRDVDINDCKEVSDLVGVYEVWIHAVYFNFSPISFCYVLLNNEIYYFKARYVLRFCECLSSFCYVNGANLFF